MGISGGLHSRGGGSRAGDEQEIFDVLAQVQPLMRGDVWQCWLKLEGALDLMSGRGRPKVEKLGQIPLGGC